MTSSRALTARHYASGRWVRVRIDGRAIGEVAEVEGPIEADDSDPWIAPALWDVQTNGRWGVSYSGGALTVEQVGRIVRAQGEVGTARLCPTLISASRDALIQGLETIAAACESDPEVDRRVLGVHLEGPWISPEDGFRGAHPREHVRDPDPEEFEALQAASGGRIAIVTLAPERPGAIAMIETLANSGVVAAIGHSAADRSTLARGVAAGLSLSTHLGNGVPAILPRHPNPIWWQAATDALFASFIADGLHLDPATLGVLIRAKTPARAILVSDASPLADAPSGRYGPWEVRDDGGIVVAGTPYLAGSNLDLWRAIPAAIDAGMTLQQAIDAATAHPAQLLGRQPPTIAEGEPADLILFRVNDDRDEPWIDLAASHIGGEWSVRDARRGAES